MIESMKWIRKPQHVSVENGKVYVTTQPHTDLWQNTYYHFCNDNAPLFLMKTDEQYFSFTVKTEFHSSHHRFDQCGVAIYQDSKNWLKASCEYENDQFSNLGSVVTNHGYSDWAVTEIPADHKTIWYRVSRRVDDYRIEYSLDGSTYHMMRIAHLWQGADTIQIGIYACSPEDSSFTAVFSDLSMGNCMWQAHDGQQPDQENAVKRKRKTDHMTGLHIRKTDLTELKVDAVVNAANTQLEEGGGVCGAIFAKAGRDRLRRACKKIGYCKTGNAVITDGFDLYADYIIHAVGPVWKGGNNDEEYLLASAYRNALETAMINGCYSIGFPLISAGIYGYPKQQAWDIALRTCLAFMEDFEEAGLSITFAVIDDEMLAMGNQILEKLKSGNNL